MTDSQPAAPKTSDTLPFRYTARLANELEPVWQDRWEQWGTYRTPNPGDPGFDGSKPRFYCLDMFPYPSGAGLHVGHPEGYTATDIISRYKRMKGHNVLHPMGWDAFGLPAEQYAIQTGVHPAITTRKAIDNFRRQLKRFGFCYDWEREFGTIDDGYYKWTQWIFLKLYDAWYDERADRARPISELIAACERAEVPTPAPWGAMTDAQRRAFVDSRRLAYIGEQVVNWCPKLGTALANDEVIDGKSERGGYPVLRKPLKQWVFRITAYADRLARQLKELDWPESTKQMQEEWIGRSEGAEIEFPVESLGINLRVFTTRPDTLFGATYMVVAPEHPLIDTVLSNPGSETDASRLRAYAEASRNRSEMERKENKEKSGVFTGVYAKNPVNGMRVPIWTADYVLMGYGTGAIMAVPAHDQRDFEFARTFGLPIRDVVYPRPIAAMHYFAMCAYPDGEPAGDWRDELADFLGQVVARMETDETFLEALAEAREIAAREARGEAATAEQRVTRLTWLETIESMGFQNFHDFRRRFEHGQHQLSEGSAYSAPGIAVNSSSPGLSLDGMPTAKAKEAMVLWLEAAGLGRRTINFRLRDWVFSRQRYWGEPIPIVFDASGRAYPVMESALPVKLPELADYTPAESDDPQPLLAKAVEWMNTTAGQAGVDPKLLDPATPVTRETNTMPGSAGSSWYAIRYCDARNSERFAGDAAEKYWMGGHGVDLYLGGSEHAVGHLLYARFWQNVLFDLGYVTTREPFKKLFHQGLITSFAFQRADKTIIPTDEVQEVSEGKYVEIATGQPVGTVVTKMSKRYKNVVNPDDVIAEFGADTFRLYEMYMGPLDASKPWNPRDITGCFRFLQRAWRLVVDENSGAMRSCETPDDKVERSLHRLIAKVGADVERLAFNTAIAAMIEFVNGATSVDKGTGVLTTSQVDRFARVLAPFAPHVAEEFYARLGHTTSVVLAPWPDFLPAMLKDDQIEMPVSVQGKLRARITVAADADVKTIESIALADPKIIETLAGKPIKKVIIVPGKMVNLVV
ncbi:MAG: leucine--tRNA ligase [Phycisphaerales bacterium]